MDWFNPDKLSDTLSSSASKRSGDFFGGVLKDVGNSISSEKEQSFSTTIIKKADNKTLMYVGFAILVAIFLFKKK